MLLDGTMPVGTGRGQRMLNGVQAKSVWLEDVEVPPADISGPLVDDVEVAVIGAGFTGLAAALALAKRGVSVAVFEAETIGWGASSRNGGMVLTGLKHDVSYLLKKYGPVLAHELWDMSLAAINCVEQIVQDETIACDFEWSGHLLLASKRGHMAGLQHEATLLGREFGHPTQMIGANELHSEIGSSVYYGGLLDEASASIHPARYVMGLAAAVRRAGAHVYEHARVEAVTRSGSHYTVRTSRGSLQARQVFVATGGYTGRAFRPLQRRLMPVGSYVIATEPLPEELAREISPHGRMFFDSKRFLYYFRLTPDRRMLFGGRASFMPDTPATVQESAIILQRGMLDVFPQLHSAKVEYAWGGTLDCAVDLMPHAGQMNGIYYSLGYAGHGVAIATYLGTMLADSMAGGTQDIPLARLAFPTAPFGLDGGKPWFLPLVGVWYRFLDRIS